MSKLPTTSAMLRKALLEPDSVALIGASDSPSKTAARPLQYLRRAGYAGRLYPINPTRTEVLGERAWPSISALPEVPEHAYILTSTSLVHEAVEACADAGVKVATVLASGFSEAGEAGRQKAQALQDVLDKSGMRLVGPSSLGVINLHHRLMLTANAAFADGDILAGGTFVGSHSGGLIGAFASRGRARGIGFAGMVSVGNEIDLTIGEICESTLDDPAVDSYLLLLESLNGGDALRRFAIGAAERRKPIVAYKLGRSAAAAELAASHTGALVGPDEVADAFFKDCGIIRANTLEGALEALPLARALKRSSWTPPLRVGVVTTTAGAAAMVVDQLGARGIDVEAPTDETVRHLADRGVDAACGRIIDLSLSGARYETMRSALEALTQASQYDLIVTIAGSSAATAPNATIQPVIDVAATGAQLATFVAPEAPQALLQLAEGGVPSFRTPEGAADAIAAIALTRPATVKTTATLPLPKERRIGTETEGYAILRRLGVSHAQSVELLVDDPDVANLPFAYPVVVKALSSSLPHKTEVGAVVLNVKDDVGLRTAIASIKDAVSRNCPDVDLNSVLVQPMAQNDGAILGEVLLGYRIERDVGPTITLAAGGVLAEIYRDQSVRLAPVTIETAREMIAEVKALRALSGYRNLRKGDLQALASAIVALSRLTELPTIAELEVNPLLIRDEGAGVLAVDALLIVGVSR